MLTNCPLSFERKSKLMDDDDDFDLPKSMQTTTNWRMPFSLPERSDATPVQVTSTELATQNERMKAVPVAIYVSDSDIPESPAPLSGVEQALDMTSQASAVIAPIPFFVPQQAAPVAVTVPYVEPTIQPAFPSAIAPPQPTVATIEVVQSLGLPLFLVGQSVHALQTLAQSPGLLSALVDVNGMYDQPRLMQLVQTLSHTGHPSEAAPTAYQSTSNIYTPMPTAAYGEPFQNALARSAPRAGKSDDGNLYVTGFGMGTTESDLIAAFSPYVQTDEVVMKGTFAFVNTSDPINAQRAREALTGTLVGGMPIRISSATRKPRENQFSSYGGAATVPSFPAAPMPGVYGPPHSETQATPPPLYAAPPPTGYVHPNVDTVRDDRGNAATKNLFVAGYGPGTTEQQLRDLVGQYATVTGVVSKGTFAFVNTSDRSGAVLARESLGGTTFNNGVLRINFAKETGRLGTSFDLTYGPNTGPNATRPRGSLPPMSYYGRNTY
jgi:RNA recognition motif-containing protein